MKRTVVVVSRVVVGLLVGLLAPGGIVRLVASQQKVMAPPASALPVQPANEDDPTGKAVAAAKAFLATLDEAGRARVSFPFDSPQKAKWSNFPVGVYPRNGVRWGDLNDRQRAAALGLLASVLSQPGLQKARQIMDGDETLKTSDGGRRGGPPGGGPPGPGGRGGPGFGRDNYFLAILGAPSLTAPWMLQFGGHHLALNVTVAGKSQLLTPSLPAAQPASYQLDGETVRPLGRENDEAFALIAALSPDQQKQAILPYQVSDLVLGPGEDGKTIQPEGIEVSKLGAAQQQALLTLAHEWVGILNDGAAAAKMAEIKSHLAATWFAWSGPTTKGSAAYFRIQGPTLLIEYAPQRARGGGGLDIDHIHTIYRDPTNDYGARFGKR